jgi:hypothetical protein
MNYIFRPENYKDWAKAAINKIEKTIDSCINVEQVEVSKKMVDNFIIITALEDDIKEEDLESVIRLFWLKIDLKKQSFLKQTQSN